MNIHLARPHVCIADWRQERLPVLKPAAEDRGVSVYDPKIVFAKERRLLELLNIDLLTSEASMNTIGKYHSTTWDATISDVQPTTGKRIIKDVPPFLRESNPILPPIISISRLVIARPSPAPSYSV